MYRPTIPHPIMKSTILQCSHPLPSRHLVNSFYRARLRGFLCTSIYLTAFTMPGPPHIVSHSHWHPADHWMQMRTGHRAVLVVKVAVSFQKDNRPRSDLLTSAARARNFVCCMNLAQTRSGLTTAWFSTCRARQAPDSVKANGILLRKPT